jgi:hypothetical protein
MKCCTCNKEIKTIKPILINYDGDFVCGEDCRKKWYENMERFYEVIAPNSIRFE